MRTLVAAVAALIVLACPVGASADVFLGKAPTTTGQSLEVWIDTPRSGETQYGRTAAHIAGIVTLRGESAQPTTIERLAVGYGDGYEAPGSTYIGDAAHQPPFWNADGLFSFEGTRQVYVTAIAADGTRATASVTFTLDPKWYTAMHAYGVLHDPAFPDGSPPALRASLKFGGQELWQQLPFAGAQVIFYVGSERVCDAITDAEGLATCSSPAAVAKAVAKGDGYTAVFRATDSYYRATDWGAAYYPRGGS